MAKIYKDKISVSLIVSSREHIANSINITNGIM